MKIALAGNPNSGKTTMFNALTGQSEQVGNWAGVTVDKKEHLIRRTFCEDGERLLAVDLPGAYSMSPFTSEESVTSSYVKEEAPDVIINIVDATNLSRSLFFTTQLLELGIPMLVALNKSDVSRKKEREIDLEKLASLLGCPVLSTTSITGEGLLEAVRTAVGLVGKIPVPPYRSVSGEISDRSAAETEDRRRFAFVASLVRAVEVRRRTATQTFTDRLDRVLTNRWFGIPIFALVMFLVFQLSQVWIGAAIADGVSFTFGGQTFGFVGLVPLIDRFGELVALWMADSAPLLRAIVVDGIVGGVGAVVGFLPLVMVLYFFIALLEDCGYMARVAVVLDPIFKKVGLSGKSVIPFVISVGCAVPGVMASRTVKDEKSRRATALLAPFMPCGAKIPVIALFAGAFFGGAGWVSALAYLLGIVIIFLVALFIRFATRGTEKNNYFIIELPDYKAPSFWGAFRSMLGRGWEYVLKAATIILLCNMAVQLMQSFTFSFALAETADASILAALSRPFSYLLYPLVGVVSWQLAAAAVTGFIAKENVVGTLAVCFVGLENLIDAEEFSLLAGAEGEVAGVMAISKVAALAYLLFNLFSPPCFAAIGAMRAELKSARWLTFGILLQFAVGYSVSYLVYTFGTLLVSFETFAPTAALAGGAFVLGLWVLVLALGTGKEKA